MAITNQTVLKKMSSELQEAMLQNENEQKVREHVRSVKLLADLLLDQEAKSDKPEETVQEPTVEEVQKMMGTASSPSENKNTDTKIDHENANGSSIFDF